MTVEMLKENLMLDTVTMPDKEKEVTGCYIGDLLSWVMSAAQTGDAWITIMSNINVVAVATLCDTALIILAEGVTVDSEVKKLATDKNINILSSKKSAYTLATEISQVLR